MIKNILKFTAFSTILLYGSCSSDEQDLPVNPSEPTIGNEVSSNIVYEANPRFFSQQDCLNELAANLPRISDMGCDILWIMPVCEPSTSPQSIGSPYSIKNYTEINPRYGTIDDLKNLVSKAHSLNLKVILDWVPNHTGWDNPWITEHPDWFLHNAKGEIISPPGQNWADVAQLDYSAPGLAQGMADAMAYWVKIADIDGFRVDYASSPQIPATFWPFLLEYLNAKKNGLIMLAETDNYSFYDYGFDMIYDWSSAPSISSAFKRGNANLVIRDSELAMQNVPQGKSILKYVFNHDNAAENPIDSYFGSIDALPAAYVCAAMLNGTPLIYSSMDAEGLKGSQSFFNYTKLTFSEKLTPVYKAINNAFKLSAEVRRGQLGNFSNGSVLAFTRSIPGKTLLVIVNCSGKEQSFVSPIVLRATTMNDLINGSSMRVPLTFELSPYSYYILMN